MVIFTYMRIKWNNELDEQLKRLIDNNKKTNEIAEMMGITIRSVENRCFRLKLKIKFYKIYQCKYCNKNFEGLVSVKRKFCSNKCSNIFTDLNRKHSKKTKTKISTSLGKFHELNTKEKKCIKVISKTGRIYYKTPNKEKICKHCNIVFESDNNRNRLCNLCKQEYYVYYRPACEFKFNIYNYLNKFNLELIEKDGWYSPTNKKNNLNGVSRDHMYSVYDGFKNKINPNIINHPANCKLLLHIDNNVKKMKSTITIEELLERIKNW